MAFNFVLPVRIVQAVFAIIVIGVLAYAANDWSLWWSPSSVNFLIFTSVWTILALVYLIVTPGRFPTLAHKYGILAAEAVTMLFWFAGFVALASLLGDINCRAGNVCGTSIAGDVFAAFEWLLFAATTIMAGLHCWRTRKQHLAKHDPNMEVHAET